MPQVVSVFDRPQLATAITNHDLEIGDIVRYESDNQMGEQKYEVVANNGGKRLKLIWDAEIGNIPNNAPLNNNMSNVSDDEKAWDDDEKDDVMGGARRRRGRKSRKSKSKSKSKSKKSKSKKSKSKKSKSKKSKSKRSRHTRRATR